MERYLRRSIGIGARSLARSLLPELDQRQLTNAGAVPRSELSLTVFSKTRSLNN
jgi:hypothetical protein